MLIYYYDLTADLMNGVMGLEGWGGGGGVGGGGGEEGGGGGGFVWRAGDGIRGGWL